MPARIRLWHRPKKSYKGKKNIYVDLQYGRDNRKQVHTDIILFDDVYRDGKYDYISEKRTYKPDDIVETLEELINNDITTGEGDRANLKEATSDTPSLKHFTRNHKLIRKANENRAVSKNKLDKQFEGYIEENNKS